MCYRVDFLSGYEFFALMSTMLNALNYFQSKGNETPPPPFHTRAGKEYRAILTICMKKLDHSDYQFPYKVQIKPIPTRTYYL